MRGGGRRNFETAQVKKKKKRTGKKIRQGPTE